MLPSWNRRGGTKVQKRRWSMIPGCIWWTMWRERNLRCFEGNSNRIQKIKLSCIVIFHFLV
ncbi:hypothetical protein MTR67_035667 [Solanum verrucosum]|uniref:Uncharacterized protein n=1 Tax=Solanum verrucosum TaxID=315347 RepID=A0AAF0UAB1_SOLVR|nr:hypothetical protein MTR67_035667 [Solanum verrucosum]